MAATGYTFYCTAYAAAGALITRQADACNAALPLQLPLILAYVLSCTVIYASSVNPLFHVLAFIPFTAPVAMPVLVAVGAAPGWQIVLSAVISLARHRAHGPHRGHHLRARHPAHRHPPQGPPGPVGELRLGAQKVGPGGLRIGGGGRLCYMNTDMVRAQRWPAGRDDAVAALYRAHALGLVRLAHVMLGDAGAAEDVVQEAFCGLWRRWGSLSDQGKALQYVRSAVINGCRSVLRRRGRNGQAGASPDAVIALADARPGMDAAAVEEAQVLMGAVRRLPHRQREAVVLRYYLDMPEGEIAAVMGISPGSVRSAISRALSRLPEELR